MATSGVSIQIDYGTSTNATTASSNYSAPGIHYESQYVETNWGAFYVAYTKCVKSMSKPIIVTFHDVGYNYNSNFDEFFQHPKMHPILESFSVIHLNAPGQEFFAVSIETDYPSFDMITEGINQVLGQFGINESNGFVGLGVGTGANILSRFALKYPQVMNGLFLVNVSFLMPSWFSSIKGHAMARLLQYSSSMSIPIRKFILKQFFNRQTTDDSSAQQSSHGDVAMAAAKTTCRRHYTYPAFNVHNFALFIESQLRQTKLPLKRQILPNRKNISCPVLLITGEKSTTLGDSIKMAAKLLPQNSSLVKLPDGDYILEDNPEQVSDALQLYLQGLGYIRKSQLTDTQGEDGTVSDGKLE